MQKCTQAHLDANRRWKIKNPDQHAIDCKQWRERNPGKARSYVNNKEPVKRIAHDYVYQHPEIKQKECEFCGSTKNLEAHHPDYAYPQIIVTACTKCHHWLKILPQIQEA